MPPQALREGSGSFPGGSGRVSGIFPEGSGAGAVSFRFGRFRPFLTDSDRIRHGFGRFQTVSDSAGNGFRTFQIPPETVSDRCARLANACGLAAPSAFRATRMRDPPVIRRAFQLPRPAALAVAICLSRASVGSNCHYSRTGLGNGKSPEGAHVPGAGGTLGCQSA